MSIYSIPSQAEYDALFEKLPNYPIVGEGGKATYRSIVDAMTIANPSSVLEIGFNRGSSALAILMANNFSRLHTTDIRTDVQDSVEYLQALFPGRMTFSVCDSKNFFSQEKMTSVDFVYIDGDHSYGGIKNDTEVALRLGAKFILFDDYHHPYHHPDVKRVFTEYKLDIYKDYYNKTFNEVCQVLVKV